MADPLVTETDTHVTTVRVEDRKDRDLLRVWFEPRGEVTQEPELTIALHRQAKDGQGPRSVGTITSTPKPTPDGVYLEEQTIERRTVVIEVTIKWSARVPAPGDPGTNEERALEHHQAIELDHGLNQVEPTIVVLEDPIVELRGQVELPEDAIDPKTKQPRWPLERIEPPSAPVELYPGRRVHLSWIVRYGLNRLVRRLVLHGGGWSAEVTDEGRVAPHDPRGGVTLDPRRHPPDVNGDYRLVVHALGREVEAKLAVRGVVDFHMLRYDPAEELVLYPVPGDVRHKERGPFVQGRVGSWRAMRQGEFVDAKPAFRSCHQALFPLERGTIVLYNATVIAPGGAVERASLEFVHQVPGEARAAQIDVGGELYPASDQLPQAEQLPSTLPVLGTSIIGFDVADLFEQDTSNGPTGLCKLVFPFREYHIDVGANYLDVDLRVRVAGGGPKAETVAMNRAIFERELPGVRSFRVVDETGAGAAVVPRWSALEAVWETTGDSHMMEFRVTVRGEDAQGFAHTLVKRVKQRAVTARGGSWSPGPSDPPLVGKVSLELSMIDMTGNVLFPTERTVEVLPQPGAPNKSCHPCPIDEARRLHAIYKEKVAEIAKVKARLARDIKVANFVKNAAYTMISQDGLDPKDVWGSLLAGKNLVGASKARTTTVSEGHEFFENTYLCDFLEDIKAQIDAAIDAANSACITYCAFIGSLEFQQHLHQFHATAKVGKELLQTIYGVPPDGEVREVEHWAAVLTEKLAAVPSGREFLQRYVRVLRDFEHDTEFPGFTEIWKTGVKAKGWIEAAGKVVKNCLEALDAHFSDKLRKSPKDIEPPMRETSVVEFLEDLGHAVTPDDPKSILRLLGEEAEDGQLSKGIIPTFKATTFPGMLDQLAAGNLHTKQQFDLAMKAIDDEIAGARKELRGKWITAGLVAVGSIGALVDIVRDPEWGGRPGLAGVKDTLSLYEQVFTLGEALTGLKESGLKAAGKNLSLELIDGKFVVVEQVPWANVGKMLSVLAGLCGILLDAIDTYEALQKGNTELAMVKGASILLGVGGILATVYGFSAFGPIGTLAGLAIFVLVLEFTDPKPVEWLKLTPWGEDGLYVLPGSDAAPACYATTEVIQRFFDAIYGELHVSFVDKGHAKDAYIRVGSKALRADSKVLVTVFKETKDDLVLLDRAARIAEGGKVDGEGTVLFEENDQYRGANEPAMHVMRPWEIWVEGPDGAGIVQDDDTEYTILARLLEEDYQLTGDVSGVRFPRPGVPYITEPNGQHWGEDALRSAGRVRRRKGASDPIRDPEYLVIDYPGQEVPFVIETAHAQGCRLEVAVYRDDGEHMMTSGARVTSSARLAKTTVTFTAQVDSEIRLPGEEPYELRLEVRLYAPAEPGAFSEKLSERYSKSWLVAHSEFLATED